MAQADSASVNDRGVVGSVPAAVTGHVHLDSLTEPITLVDLQIALSATKKNKSPGTDGIPYEFYVQFWDAVGPHFLAMVNHVLSTNQLLPSQGSAAIRLLPKVPHPKKMTDYRPISLLNTDYKVIASALAHRLRRTLPLVLGNHQKGGVPGRYIHDSLALFRDVIDHAGRKTNRGDTKLVDAAIIAYDLEKAYDLVNRDVLWGIMAAMGYPIQFVDWLKTLYSITQLCPLNGSAIVGTIDDAQSVRQGCPLSIHLFAIYVEPLLMRLSRSIVGFDLLGEQVKVRAFVDDLTVFVSSRADILRACGIIEEFCAWTNARINKAKTKLLGLGNWAIENDNPPKSGQCHSPIAQLTRATSSQQGIDGSSPARDFLNPRKRKRGSEKNPWPVE